MAFPCIFQTGAADFNAERREAVSFPQRFRHILMNEEGRAMRDSRFRYWAFNTNGRKGEVRSRQAFLQQEPSAADIDIAAIAKADKQALVNKMIAFASKIPSTLGESTRARSDIECMANQIEWETSRRGDNDGMGRIPALFMTLTAPVYKWEMLNRLIRRWIGAAETIDRETADERRRRFFADANAYPEIVERYVTLKIEMVLMLAREIIPASVDNSFIAWEWGAGGVTRLHSVLWAASSPRMDVVAEDEKARGACSRGDLLLDPEALRQLADYFDQYISEVRPSKPIA